MVGVLTDSEISAAIRRSTVYGHYEKELDRESAYEMLRASAMKETSPPVSAPKGTRPAPEQSADTRQASTGGALSDILFGRTGPRGGKTDGLVQASAKSLARTIGSSVGREIVRGVLGSLLGKKR